MQPTVGENDLSRLLEDRNSWNRWRQTHPEVNPSLRNRDLKGAELKEFDLTSVDFFNCDLRKANLSGANLHHADLTGANLSRATLSGADLSGCNANGTLFRNATLDGCRFSDADCDGADFASAMLSHTKFDGASLWNTSLWDSDLQGADLSSSKMLLQQSLRGANLRGTMLPEPARSFDALSYVEQNAKYSNRLFISMILGCLYSWLTIGATTDAHLLTNSASSPLPIINTAIPVVGFYIVAPVLLFSLHVYFLIYLQRLWDSLANLPAIFQDGTNLDEKAYPWILNGLVRSHIRRLRSRRPHLYYTQMVTSVGFAWLTVPLTVALFWWRYLSRHDWTITSFHIALMIGCGGFSLTAYLLARETLRGGGGRRGGNTLLAWNRAIPRAIIIVTMAVGTREAITTSRNVIASEPPPKVEAGLDRPQDFLPWPTRIRQALRESENANLESTDVSIKPPSWTGRHDDELAAVRGAGLARRNLRLARATRAFLVNADLDHADVEGANLSWADLRGARLTQTNLKGVALIQADLANADLWGANLEDAILVSANLRGANLFGANLARAFVQNTDFTGVRLCAEGNGSFEHVYTEAVWSKSPDIFNFRGGLNLEGVSLSAEQEKQLEKARQQCEPVARSRR